MSFRQGLMKPVVLPSSEWFVEVATEGAEFQAPMARYKVLFMLFIFSFD